jgi:hypothetical protein
MLLVLVSLVDFIFAFLVKLFVFCLC